MRFSLHADIIFSKGGYASFPVLVAARFFRIPVVIHESDSFPGRTNQWSAKFAKKIAISYPETVKFFDKNKTAWTGNPLRKAILSVNKSGAHEYFGFEKQLPTIFVIGGSLGAKIINEAILNALPHLINHYQIIHQTGKNNLAEVNKTAAVILDNNPNHTRYRTFDYLANLPLTMAAGVADLVITRAGSTIFEIASWGLPSIVIPITESNGNHQRLNAYAYSRSGSAEVIEEANLTTNVLVSEVDRLLKDQTILEKMRTNAKNFAKLDAATKIARELINIALSHEE